MKPLLQALIRLYTLAVSPLLGPNCRFRPTCSAYAHKAVDIHGPWKGLKLAVKRIGKCHPLHKGPFYDPVPEDKDTKPAPPD